METITITVDSAIAALAQELVANGAYGSVSEAFSSALKEFQKVQRSRPNGLPRDALLPGNEATEESTQTMEQQRRKRLMQLLEEGLASGSRQMTDADWDEMLRRHDERHPIRNES